MIRILHLADLHLGRSHSYLGDKAAERKKEADGVLRRIVDRVLGDPIEVDAIVLAGDLFEGHKPEDFVFLSGTKVREMLSNGEDLPPEFARPEVAKILMEYYQSQA